MQAIVDQYHPHEEKQQVTRVRFAAEPTSEDRNDDHLFNDADVSVELTIGLLTHLLIYLTVTKSNSTTES